MQLRQNTNNNKSHRRIEIRSVTESCIMLADFLNEPSLTIETTPFGNDIRNKLFESAVKTIPTSVHVLDDEIHFKLSQIPNKLCEIERLNNNLTGMHPNQVESDSLLILQRDKRDKLSNELCMNLMALMKLPQICELRHRSEEITLDQLIYEIALTLANLNPINSIDFATQEPISTDRIIVTSDRYQHDLDSLQTWLRHKDTNLWTNLKFSRKDIEFIKLNFEIRKRNDAIAINEGNPYPGGDPNLDATLALAHRLQRGDDGSRRVIPLNNAYVHHEVDSIQDLHASAVRFFRTQRDLPSRVEYSELDVIAWQAYRALGHENTSRDQTNTSSESYTGISVHDLPNFNEIINSTPHYWPTNLRQTDSTHNTILASSLILGQAWNDNTVVLSTEDLNNAKIFKDKLIFFITHFNEWDITDTANYIKTELLSAYSLAPTHIQHIHNTYTNVTENGQVLTIFKHITIAMTCMRQCMKMLETGRMLTIDLVIRRNQRLTECVHDTVVEYAEKLNTVVDFINSILEHHTPINVSDSNLLNETDNSGNSNHGSTTSTQGLFGTQTATVQENRDQHHADRRNSLN